MITKICLIAPIVALGITFSSQIVQAAESSDAGLLVTSWPLVVLSIVLIIFRKQLIVQATPEPVDSEHHESSTNETPVAETETPKSKANINIKESDGQCQASTSKGTRCKRKSNLENASVSIDGKTYALNVCKQHNNDTLQPFSEIIE